MTKNRPRVAFNPRTFCDACKKRHISKRQLLPLIRRLQDKPELGSELPGVDGVYIWETRVNNKKTCFVYLIDAENDVLQFISVCEGYKLEKLTKAERMMLGAHFFGVILRIIQMLLR
ncbi:hypothetical protein [Breoghania sp. JC706]|uniref:hypothetical protein n=1 Tax=Breoghania sp. JC706 TaxID=3117732 RepID=UPI003009E79F